jgi:regulatory protein
VPIITDLRPQRNKKRVNVYLDGRFSFGIDLENLVRLNLKIEEEYSEKEIRGIIKRAEFQKTYDKLVRYSTLRPRSKREVETWFKKYKVHESLHDELFNKLKRLELLDDTKFAKWWVEQRITFRPRGKKALMAELRQKGIDRYIIDEVLTETDIDEEKMAKKLLERRKYRWERLNKLEARKKKSDFLARKGFSWEIIKQLVK